MKNDFRLIFLRFAIAKGTFSGFHHYEYGMAHGERWNRGTGTSDMWTCVWTLQSLEQNFDVSAGVCVCVWVPAQIVNHVNNFHYTLATNNTTATIASPPTILLLPVRFEYYQFSAKWLSIHFQSAIDRNHMWTYSININIGHLCVELWCLGIKWSVYQTPPPPPPYLHNSYIYMVNSFGEASLFNRFGDYVRGLYAEFHWTPKWWFSRILFSFWQTNGLVVPVPMRCWAFHIIFNNFESLECITLVIHKHMTACV